jgi:hypothetical protein
MRYFLIALIISFLPYHAFSLEKLHSDYLVTFGNRESKVQIVQYFSFMCPHCLQLFKKDFQEIKNKYIENGQVTWIFHPVPMDLLSVQAMDCLEKLSEKEKRIFLRVILEMISFEDIALGVSYMQKAMEIFNQSLPDLQKKEYLSNTRAFQDAFHFLKQKEKIEAVPIVEINGKLFLKDIPNQEFIEQQIQRLLEDHSS